MRMTKKRVMKEVGETFKQHHSAPSTCFTLSTIDYLNSLKLLDCVVPLFVSEWYGQKTEDEGRQTPEGWQLCPYECDVVLFLMSYFHAKAKKILAET